MIWVKAFFIWLFKLRPVCVCDQYYGMKNEDCKVCFPKEADNG